MPVKLLILLAIYSASACQSNDLYIIVDTSNQIKQSYPKVYQGNYKDQYTTWACFLSDEVELFSPYCFTSHDEKAEKIGNLSGLKGEAWNQNEFDQFLARSFLSGGKDTQLVNPANETLASCTGLLDGYNKVFMLIKKREPL
ncbi:MAG: hypothetical protein RIC30_04520 [Marinoscillum sp.]|uniref:hypothetical protein n=1 Tax=Marinoscillum sp. TaxID=2024838 RepID=UPI0032FBEF50